MFQYRKAKPNKSVNLFGLALFFLIFIPLSAFALSNPSVKTGSVSPNSGSFTPDQAIIFNTSFYDARGFRDIASVKFMVNTTFIFPRKCFYAVYLPRANKLYLLSDNGRNYLGGFSPGSNKVIENSYCKLDCLKTSVNAYRSTLIVNWAVTFKSTFTGTKNLYLYVKAKRGGFDGWDKKGKISITTDAIAPTGTITINNDSGYTNSTPVTLSLSAQDNPGGSGVSQMQFSNDNTNWLTPESYAATKSWTLIPGDGIKTVYVKFKDIAGNWSQAYQDTIILDTTAPELNITSPLDNKTIRP